MLSVERPTDAKNEGGITIGEASDVKESTGDRAWRRRKNRNQIETYVLLGEAFHPLSRGEAQVRAEGKRQKGKSLAPWSGKAERLIDNEDYAHARRRIEPALNKLHNRGPQGRRLRFMLRQASQDPAAVAWWQEGQTPGDRAYRAVYRKAIRELEGEVEGLYPGVALRVPTDPDSPPEEEPITVETTYREIAGLVDKWMDQDYSKTAAVHEVAAAEECAPSKVWRAMEHVERAAR
jgi:hypothetical protein